MNISYLVSQIFRNRGVKVQDDTKQIEEVMAKRTAKNSVFLDLFQNKSYLLKLYKTLHPEDTTATEDSLTDVTIENVLTDNLYNDLGFLVGNRLMILIEAQSLCKSFQISKESTGGGLNKGAIFSAPLFSTLSVFPN